MPVRPEKAENMEHQITGLETEMGYLIQFPDEMLAEKITGTLYLENVRDKPLSFEQPLVLSGNNLLIPKERLDSLVGDDYGMGV